MTIAIFNRIIVNTPYSLVLCLISTYFSTYDFQDLKPLCDYLESMPALQLIQGGVI